ncbi:MAG TPA: dihydrodipicolinate synthase family protein, partial [Candidatus Saccharimonadales bacterium]|nr:dihydrodipicolinate synthase family protein [Candidatus Saccharimonadales bacterium]
LIDGGVSAIFVLGTTGEGPALSYKLRKEMVQQTCRFVKGRVPVLVGITDPSFVEAIGMAQYAAKAGADAVVSAGPFYFPVTQPELEHYVECLLAESPLPLMLYNMPGLTKVTYGLKTVRRLMRIKKVIGIKDSSGDMDYIQEIIRVAKRRKDFTVLIGPETLTAEAVLMGAHGGVSGGAMFNPRLYTDLCAAALKKDYHHTVTLHQQVMDLTGRIYNQGFYAMPINRNIKAALSLMGICDDFVCEPYVRCDKKERKILEKELSELGLLRKKKR